jgi:hypothetical protein
METHMLIPNRIAQLTGWKAVVWAVVILGVVGLGILAKFAPRSVARGTWNIEPGKMQGASLVASKSARKRVECEATGGGSYAVYVMDEANAALLKSPNPEQAQKLASQEGSGKVIINQMQLGAGTYYVVIANAGSSDLTVKYNVFELPRD